jgi:hypothetical protein
MSSVTLSPAAMTARGKIASLSRSRPPDDPELLGWRHTLVVERIARQLQAELAAEPLTRAERAELAALLLADPVSVS